MRGVFVGMYSLDRGVHSRDRAPSACVSTGMYSRDSILGVASDACARAHCVRGMWAAYQWVERGSRAVEG